MVWKKSYENSEMLNNANRNFSPCNLCDVVGTFMGEKNSSYFRENR